MRVVIADSTDMVQLNSSTPLDIPINLDPPEARVLSVVIDVIGADTATLVLRDAAGTLLLQVPVNTHSNKIKIYMTL